MTQLVYRGVAYTRTQDAPKTLAEQMKKGDLVYRGVAHDGERPVTEAPTKTYGLIYRGVQLA